MKIKRYEDFTNEGISLKKALVGGAIGASTILPPTYTGASSPTTSSSTEDTLAGAVDKSNTRAIIDFVNVIENDTPALFIDCKLTEKTKLSFGQYERIKYLKTRADQYSESTGANLNLDLITNKPDLFPFNINYFVIRGIDNLDSPTLINILRLDYSTAIKIGGHDVMFNFTRVQDVNTFGVRVNF